MHVAIGWPSPVERRTPWQYHLLIVIVCARRSQIFTCASSEPLIVSTKGPTASPLRLGCLPPPLLVAQVFTVFPDAGNLPQLPTSSDSSEPVLNMALTSAPAEGTPQILTGNTNTTSEEASEDQKHHDHGLAARARRQLLSPIDDNLANLPMLVCCFVTGLLDTTMFQGKRLFSEFCVFFGGFSFLSLPPSLLALILLHAPRNSAQEKRQGQGKGGRKGGLTLSVNHVPDLTPKDRRPAEHLTHLLGISTVRKTHTLTHTHH